MLSKDRANLTPEFEAELNKEQQRAVFLRHLEEKRERERTVERGRGYD
jgi:hypothetical protein